MFRIDCQKKALLELSVGNIKYAEEETLANKMASKLIDAIEKDSSQHIPIGFDLEGSDYHTAQLYTVIDWKRYAYLFQINWLTQNLGKLPLKVSELFGNKKIIFVGKNVERDIVGFLHQHGFDKDRIENVFFIDVLSLVRVFDTFSRENLDDAINYVSSGEFVIAKHGDERIDDNVLKDAGIRAATNYILDKNIDKRLRHKNPHKTDFSRKDGKPLTKAAIEYAANDAHSAFLMALEAAKRLEVNPFDFARRARNYPSLQPPKPFFTATL